MTKHNDNEGNNLRGNKGENEMTNHNNIQGSNIQGKKGELK